MIRAAARQAANRSLDLSPLYEFPWLVLEKLFEEAQVFSRTQRVQGVLLVDADGASHRRCYSFSTSPLADGLPAITVKRMPQGVDVR